MPSRTEKAHSCPCPIDSDLIFDRMFFKLAGYQDSYKISDMFDFGPGRTFFFGVTCPCPWAMKNFPIGLQWRQCCPDDSDFTFDPIFVNLAAIKSLMGSTSSQSDYSHQSYLPLSAEKAHIWLCPIDTAFNFDRIFIKLAGNQDSHKFSDEFEFRPDQTFYLRVTCPWEPKKPIFDLVQLIVPSILMGSSSNLQVARRAINSRISSNLGQIRLLTSV